MKKVLKLWLLSIALLMLSQLPASAQDLPPFVLLKGATINNATPLSPWLDSIAQIHTGNESVQAIIQFSILPTPQQRILLQQNGIILADYIPNNSFLAFVQFPVNKALIAQIPIKSVINILPQWKMDYEVQQLQGTAPVTVLMSFYPVVDAKTIKAFVEQQGGKIVPNNMEAYGSYAVSIAPAKLNTIAQWYGTMYINMPTTNALLDIATNAAGKASIARAGAAVGGYDLLGDGMAIGIGDDASGIYHTDLKDRVINYNPAPTAEHGEHINGIVGGAAIIDPYAQGVAPHVTLVDQFFDNIIAVTGLMYQAHKIVVTNNSYATQVGNCDYAGRYDAYSRILDTISLQYGNVLHVFASANDGGLTCNGYPTGFGTIAGGYQVSKNALVVGNSNKLLLDRFTSSQGPARDGRLKPEVSAVGVDVYSTVFVDQYLNETGTSMACPGVSGAAILLAQRYKQLHGNTTPPSDILKALMANGATDQGNPGPDYTYGFGFLNLYRSLQMLDNNRYFTNIINTGGQQTYTVNVPVNTALLKVMLYWNDAPANVMAANQLVNDLDLSVQSPTGTHLPLVLDTAHANVNNAATERADHVNNCEQVVITNPTTGSYTIHVNGYHIPSGTTPYVVAYDFVPVGLRIDYPFTGTAVSADDSLRIYWDASDDNNTFTIQYSIDNGANWTTLSNNVPSAQRYYNWLPTSISSGRCRIKLIRNNTSQQYTTGSFVINPKLVAQLDSTQCPGYISLYWQPVASATAYQVWRKIGPAIQVIDTVTTTKYALGGLSLDSTYFMAISPIIDGASGYRSIAVNRRPNTGNCRETYSNGDLMVRQVVAPNSGRQHTSTALTNNETMSVVVRNLSQVGYSNALISYSINNSPWQTQLSTTIIPGNDTLIVPISGIDFSALGSYHMRVAVTNQTVTDPVHQNDTLDKTIINIANDPVDLTTAFTDGFEGMDSIILLNNLVGISPDGHWDYSNSNGDTSRLRSYINDSFLITGHRSISMDALLNDSNGVQNYLTGTFNLSNYSAQTSEVRLEFDYLLHGKPKFTDGNDVWVRGADNQPWIKLYNYDLDSRPGSINNSGTLSVSDAMLQNNQDFSGSLQVRFGQHDTSLIAAKDYGNGITFDNVKIYTVQNDANLVSIITPQMTECGLGTQAPLVVKIKNGVNVVLNNVLLFYQLDSGVAVGDTLSSLAAKDSVVFTFKKNLDLSALGTHTLSVWLAAAGDTYKANDSILHYQFHNQPLISSYPYLQDFEATDGYWYADGINSTWQYGTLATRIIDKAASGTKVWKTNLTGNYNNMEQSYLYSPCFDIAQLTSPMLSFSVALDIENCGETLCDGAYIEYSYDGTLWTKLGAQGQGTNWYNDEHQLWSEHGNTRWHVASIPLPQSTQPIRLRFVMKSDPGVAYDGIAIDDIHIYDRTYPSYTGNDVSVSNDAVANQWTSFVANGGILAQLQPTRNSNNTTASLYAHDVLANPTATQYYFPKSYAIKAPTENGASDIRLYITDADVLKMLNDTTCTSCTKPDDAYRLGITQYSNRNTDLENGTLDDNMGGIYSYHPASSVKWVPYDQGYYAQINTSSFSELWLNDGGPSHNVAAGLDYLTFGARKIDPQHVQADWTSVIDTAITSYELQRSYDVSSFSTIYTNTALHQVPAKYTYTDTPTVTEGGVVYYKLKWLMNNGRTYFSPIRRVDWTTENQLIALYPNPVHDGNIFIRWTANTGNELRLSIADISGRVVYQTVIIAPEWNNYSVIQIPRFRTGMYFVRMMTGDKQYVRKLIYE